MNWMSTTSHPLELSRVLMTNDASVWHQYMLFFLMIEKIFENIQFVSSPYCSLLIVIPSSFGGTLFLISQYSIFTPRAFLKADFILLFLYFYLGLNTISFTFDAETFTSKFLIGSTFLTYFLSISLYLNLSNILF